MDDQFLPDQEANSQSQGDSNFAPITKEEFEKVAKFSNHRSKFSEALDKLEVNSGLKVLKEQWNLKSDPIVMASSFSRGLKKKGAIKRFSGVKLEDGTGWYVLRTE